MKELFNSIKKDFKKALALWIITHQDLICACIKIYCTTLAYLQMGVCCLTLPYQFVKLFVQKLKKTSE
jgi:uncharacterized membrane protein YbhN (UPF0104 family)